ncbi:NTP transferase domain-containing protein [Chitinophaga sp. Cy-1792]|uniref:nucleotidyltransferase family protein n=1 Tax=Chitinophaga sp. Cy-1792 TaxID=2608339 RepID=UPI00141FD0FF|nr:nucleotidyltransferase family protein [Chitinophaga sp. Cy-1792]NIG57415.1 nucleotidyltransferase family protein [Chitinophaga sp. Cy-1792]
MTGIIILAAGNSSRLGKPKQLLLLQEKTLLQKITDTAIESNLGPVLVVLGAYAPDIQQSIAGRNVKIIVNENWKSGMGSSVACGINALLRLYSNVTSAFLLVCDQPFIEARLLHRMAAINAPMVACKYNNTFGTPALFQQDFFPELQALGSHEGAKKILSAHQELVKTVDFPQGSIDIDTLSDYETVLSSPQ